MISTLIELRTKPLLGKFAFEMLKLLGMEVPVSVVLGKDVEFIHGGKGVITHPRTIIKDKVKIFHQVTIGNANVYDKSLVMEKIIIEEGAILCAGAKILCKEGTLTVGKNTIIGANAVLLESTGENEIWSGMPAKRIKQRSKRSVNR